jgi:hypothetical protein
LECTHNCIPQCNSKTLAQSSSHVATASSTKSESKVAQKQTKTDHHSAFQMLADLYSDGKNVQAPATPSPEDLDTFGAPTLYGSTPQAPVTPVLKADEILNEALPDADAYRNVDANGVDAGGKGDPQSMADKTQNKAFESALAQSMKR